jgi:predicted DNA-binding transcriptional regulator AlpA
MSSIQIHGNRRIKEPSSEIDGRQVPDWMQLMSLRQVTAYLGVGRSIVLSSDGPPPIRLGPKTLRWSIAGVWAWMDHNTDKGGV